MSEQSKPTLTWTKPMTSSQASKYHMTHGFVACELYDKTCRDYAQVVRERDRLAIALKRLVEDSHHSSEIDWYQECDGLTPWEQAEQALAEIEQGSGNAEKDA